jgi:hypothetical protein
MLCGKWSRLKGEFLMKHTESEWEADDRCILIKHKEGGYLRIARFDRDMEEAKASAKRAVIAVNSHTALVDALDKMTGLVRFYLELAEDDIRPSEFIKKESREALALAGGKGEK